MLLAKLQSLLPDGEDPDEDVGYVDPWEEAPGYTTDRRPAALSGPAAFHGRYGPSAGGIRGMGSPPPGPDPDGTGSAGAYTSGDTGAALQGSTPAGMRIGISFVLNLKSKSY